MCVFMTYSRLTGCACACYRYHVILKGRGSLEVLLEKDSLASQTFARKTGGSGDISIAVAVPVQWNVRNVIFVAS